MPNPEKEMTTNLHFTDLFDLKEIQEFQEVFSAAHGVASFIAKVDGTPITQQSNFCNLCELIRNTKKGNDQCFKYENHLTGKNPKEPIIHPCVVTGLWNAAVRIKVGPQHIANWVIGQVKSKELDKQQILKDASKIGIDKEVFSAALDKAPTMSKEQFNNIAKMLHVFANQISEKAYSNFLLKKQIEKNKLATKLIKETEKHTREEAKFIDIALNSQTDIFFFLMPLKAKPLNGTNLPMILQAILMMK